MNLYLYGNNGGTKPASLPAKTKSMYETWDDYFDARTQLIGSCVSPTASGNAPATEGSSRDGSVDLTTSESVALNGYGYLTDDSPRSEEDLCPDTVDGATKEIDESTGQRYLKGGFASRLCRWIFAKKSKKSAGNEISDMKKSFTGLINHQQPEPARKLTVETICTKRDGTSSCRKKLTIELENYPEEKEKSKIKELCQENGIGFNPSDLDELYHQHAAKIAEKRGR